MDLSLGTTYIPTEDGYFVSQKQAQIAEIIHDYDPDLRLAWIPPDKRYDPKDPPFAIIHSPVGKPEYVAFYVQEDELDERVLVRIFMGDVTKQKQTILDRVDAQNAAVRALQLKKQMDELDDAQDRAKHILRSPKSTYTIDDLVIHSDKPVERRPKPKVL